MNSFNTTKRKLKKLRESNIANDLNIDLIQNQKEETEDKILRLKASQSRFQVNRRLNADWQDMNLGDPNQEDTTDPQYMSWEYTIPRFDIRYLPYVTVEFVLREKIINNADQSNMPFLFANRGVYFTVEDLEFQEEVEEIRQERIKKVTIAISLDLRSVIYYLPQFDENDFDGIQNVFEIYPIVVIPNLRFFT